MTQDETGEKNYLHKDCFPLYLYFSVLTGTSSTVCLWKLYSFQFGLCDCHVIVDRLSLETSLSGVIILRSHQFLRVLARRRKLEGPSRDVTIVKDCMHQGKTLSERLEKKRGRSSEEDDPGGAARCTESCRVVGRGYLAQQYDGNVSKILRGHDASRFDLAAWREVQ